MMLGLWSQVARPQLSCSCITCSGSVTGILARRTASATTRRRLKLVDAFTILLAPVFATAFVADANWKDRRRIEWDRKIAEVEGEVERLQRKESQILRSWNSGVNARRKRIDHIRSYSTDARLPILENDTKEDVNAQQWWSIESEVEEEDEAHQASFTDIRELLPPHRQMAEDTTDAVRRIERLVALKFAIRMLLHVNVGSSPRFKDANPGYTHDPRRKAEDLNGLIGQLKIIRRSLRSLNSAEERPDVPAFQKMPRHEQAVIDREIRHCAHEFKLGNLSVASFVIKIGNSIIRSPEPPSVKAYIPLMTAFSRARLDELAYLVMAAMDEGRLTLSNHSLSNIIWQYGKNRDANRFELFLNSVTKADAASKYTEPWEWRMVNEVEVPCPMSNDSRLLQILVYTALKCNQPHRAEAWASQLRFSNSPPRHNSHVLRNFMKFYATHRDWQRGQVWLSAGLSWSVSPGPNVIRDIQRVVFAMLELCVACGKQDAYTCILQAAVHARIGVFTAETDLKFTERSKSILAEWDQLHSSALTIVEDDYFSAQSKARDFCCEVTSKLEDLGLTQALPRFEWPSPVSAGLEFGDKSSELSDAADGSASHWRELCKQQAAELGKVKAQLAETKWLLSRNARSHIEEDNSRASASPLTSAETSEAPIKSLADYSISSLLKEETLLPSSNIAATVSSYISQENKISGLDVGQPNSDLKQKRASTFAQAAGPGQRRSKTSGMEDLIKASTSSSGHFNPRRKAETAGAQESLSDEVATESTNMESSSYPDNPLRPNSIQSNVLSKFRPSATTTENLGEGIDHFQDRNVHRPKSDGLDSPNEQSSRPSAPSSGVTLPQLVDTAMNEHASRASAPSSTGADDVSETATELQTIETCNQTEKSQWISFLKMPRSRKLSARATLRYIHLQKSENPKHVQPEPIKYKDKKAPPIITLRLSQLPPPKAVKFVKGTFKPRKWSTTKAEAYAAKMKARPIYNGRG